MEGLHLFIIAVILCQNSQWVVGQPLPYVLTYPYQSALAEREVQVYNSLKSYKDSLLNRLKLINQYLQDYEDCQHGKYSAQENPIKATRMIRRFPKYVDPIKKLLKDGNLEKELFTSLDTFSTEDEYNFPGEHDYLESLEAFLSLQYIYNLKPIEIMDGYMNGVETGVGFTARQSLEIAAYALQSKFFTLSYEWLSAVREKYPQKRRVVEELQKRLFIEHDKVFETEISEDERYIFTSTLSNSSTKSFPKSRREEMLPKWGKNRDWFLRWGNDTTQAEHYSYLSLCNGIESQTPKEKKALKCWLSYDAFKIFPVKLEQLSRDPDLVQFHDIVSNKWIDILKGKAVPVIREGNVKRTPERIFNGLDFAWMAYNKIPIQAKIESLSKLKIRGLNGSENLKIGVYGKGGRFRIHQDATPGYKEGSVVIQFGIDSLQTFLIYMTDVDVGGATVFPPLGITVFPEKGSAIYWSNIDTNGDPDARTLHAACPVLLGHKWIATQWMGLEGNGYGNKCSLDARPFEIHVEAWNVMKNMQFTPTKST